MIDMVSVKDFRRTRYLDTSGNQRYVVHFLRLKGLLPNEGKGMDILQMYSAVLKEANKLGGRKFHNQEYGGGVVFQSYDVYDTAKSINKAIRRKKAKSRQFVKWKSTAGLKKW